MKRYPKGIPAVAAGAFALIAFASAAIAASERVLFASLGEKENALKWLERAKLIDPDDNNARYNAACTYAQLGEIDEAMAMLEEWSKNCGAEQEMWFLHDSDLDPVRDHSRYSALLDKFKERPDQMMLPPTVPAS